MPTIRRYLIDYTADVFRGHRLQFDTTLDSTDITPELTPQIKILELDALKKILAERCEIIEGQDPLTVDSAQIQIVSIVQVGAEAAV